jgi:hypothetical protein
MLCAERVEGREFVSYRERGDGQALEEVNPNSDVNNDIGAFI